MTAANDPRIFKYGSPQHVEAARAGSKAVVPLQGISPPPPKPQQPISPPSFKAPANPGPLQAPRAPSPSGAAALVPFKGPGPSSSWTGTQGTSQRSTVWFRFVDEWFEDLLGTPARRRAIHVVMALLGTLLGYAYSVARQDVNTVPYLTMGALGGLLFLTVLRMAIKIVLLVITVVFVVALAALIVYSFSYFWG
jgi:hypothetical protein